MSILVRYAEIRDHLQLNNLENVNKDAVNELLTCLLGLFEEIHVCRSVLLDEFPSLQIFYDCVKCIEPFIHLLDNFCEQNFEIVKEKNLPKHIQLSFATLMTKFDPKHILQRFQKFTSLVDTLSRHFTILEDGKSFLQGYVSTIVPNLKELLGAKVSVDLLIFGGGLNSLAEISHLGYEHIGVDYANYKDSTVLNHCGVLYLCDIVQAVNQSQRRKVLRMVSANTIHAVRMDSTNLTDLTFIQKRIEKINKKVLQLNEKTIIHKKPLDIPGKKTRSRGGRRHRKMKEKKRQSSAQKLQNIMQFGRKEETIGLTGVGLGVLDRTEVVEQLAVRAEKKTYFNPSLIKKSLDNDDHVKAKAGSNTFSFIPVKNDPKTTDMYSNQNSHVLNLLAQDW
ncbi:hypothetical protein PCE1_000380 [Barthelona sp. PCE]